MISEIRMPQLGVSMETGTISEWHKKVGDPVKAGDVLLSIETEKLTNDIPSESDGVLLAIVAKEGDELPIQALLGIVGQPGDTWEGQPADVPAAPQPEAAASAAPAVPAAPAAADKRIKASPLARKVAAALGVDLSKITARGTSGRIRERDVRLCYQQMTQAQTPVPAPAPQPVPAERRERMSAARRVIARRMTDSILTAPQVTLTREVNADRLLALHQEIKTSFRDVKVSINDLLIRLLAAAVVREPVLNVSVDGDCLIHHDHINIGVAVALDDGLLVPVVRDADQKGALAIAAETGKLIAQARSGSISPDALTGGTITISNLGSFGVDGFTPIVNLPEVAIMGIGRIVRKPAVAADGSLCTANMMMLSLSFDHRAADGATAAKFLKAFAELVENPGFALL